MGFHEVDFPTGLTYGTRGGPAFSTAAIEQDTGIISAIARWSSPRRHYDAAWGIKTRDDLMTVVEFYIARDGATNGFRFKDWLDYASTSDHRTDTNSVTNLDVVIGTGDDNTKTFQLKKLYGDTDKVRTIEKPVSGTVVIAIDGVDQPSGWTVDTTTGIVTFTTAPALDEVVTAGFEFAVPVMFDPAIDIDGIRASLEAFDTGDIPDIPLIEQKQTDAHQDLFFFGGGKAQAVTEDFSLSLLTARAYALTPDASGYKAKLPDESSLPGGGPYFMIANLSGTYTIDLTYDDETAIVTIASASVVMVYLVGSTWHVVTG